MVVKKLLYHFDVDRAVGYAVIGRGWQLPAGFLTTLLIATYFREDTQGFYYTIVTLIGLQTLADSGLQGLLLNFASHERAQLQISERGELSGAPLALARLASLFRFGLTWFCVAAVVFLIGVLITGWLLLSRADAQVPWHFPLALTLLLASISLAWSPLITLLEGCNQVAVINRMRLLQAVSGSFVAWISIVAGGGLWTLVWTALTQVVWEAWLLWIHYRATWIDLRRQAPGHLSWRRELWPLQWRLAAQVASRHFAYTPLIPVILENHGAALAGQLGITWAVLTNIQLASLAWIRTRSPRYGMLIAQRDFEQLDRQFTRTVLVTLLLLVTLGGLFCLLLALLPYSSVALFQKLGRRFLDPRTALVFSAAIVPLHLVQCLGLYLRAHKRDPLLVVTCLGNLVLGIAVFYLGSAYGPLAAGLGMLAVLSLITLPGVVWVWSRSRRQWHLLAPTSIES